MRLLPTSLLLAASLASSAFAALPLGPTAAQPIAVGATVPRATLQTPDGTEVDLRQLALEQPTIFIVYRGGWCPYCNTHLGELAAIEEDLAALGYRIVAFSPERPATLAAALAEHPAEHGRLVLSDRAMHASAALGLAYQMPPAVHAKYLEYGLDLAPIADQPGEHWLPVPAAIISDRAGRISFVYTNADIKQRVDPAALLAAARDSLK